MLLIFPPLAKSGEPPAGIAKLAGALTAHGISCSLVDANLEGQLYLLGQSYPASDTWTRRGVKHAAANIVALRNPLTYRSFDRYSRAVKDLNRVLEMSAKDRGIVMGLADYQDNHLSPVQSADLLKAAKHPEQNPFYPWFSRRLPEMMKKTHFSQRRGGRTEEHEEGKDSEQLVGFSLNYLSQALCTFSMIGFLKKEFPGVKTVLGGGLVSSWTKRPGWRNPFSELVDYIISGAGERPLLELHGITDMHEHYPPDYESLPLPDYLSPGVILPYSASSGCYWNKCSFCPETAEDNPYVPIPANRVIDELILLASKIQPVLIHLLDNSISPALMKAFADTPPTASWYGFARISKDMAEPDFCMALKRSGCVMLKLGLESGDQGVLDRMRKGIDLATASRVLNNLSKAGIASYVYLLFGTPAETITEARKTLEFVVSHQQAVTFLNLAIFNMPLCGQEAAEYENEEFYEGDLSLYTGFKHPRGFDRRIVRQFLEYEFKRHPVISAILKNDPPLFTSNHAALFSIEKKK
ncbi:MAG TPA: radical SAM protein [Nitrospirota bacterium]|nr:radical SAM protein [Nitrospirota bacterium]